MCPIKSKATASFSVIERNLFEKFKRLYLIRLDPLDKKGYLYLIIRSITGQNRNLRMSKLKYIEIKTKP